MIRSSNRYDRQNLRRYGYIKGMRPLLRHPESFSIDKAEASNFSPELKAQCDYKPDAGEEDYAPAEDLQRICPKEGAGLKCTALCIRWPEAREDFHACGL